VGAEHPIRHRLEARPAGLELCGEPLVLGHHLRVVPVSSDVTRRPMISRRSPRPKQTRYRFDQRS
jgi:hypothetical protein